VPSLLPPEGLLRALRRKLLRPSPIKQFFL
jgi:hypothetical protein